MAGDLGDGTLSWLSPFQLGDGDEGLRRRAMGGRYCCRFAAENEALADIISATGGATVTEAFFAPFILMCALLVAGFAIRSALRARGEETSGRAEPSLAAAVSRSRWVAGHLTVAGGAAILVATPRSCLPRSWR